MKKDILQALQTVSPIPLEEHMLERPAHAKLGDFALPCFPFAKVLRKSPVAIAEEIAASINHPLIQKAEAVNGYVNLFMNREVIADTLLQTILQQSTTYGTSNEGNDGVVTIDLSSPNIAKPFSMGHLRSTVIGNSIALLLEKIGYKPVKINYIGDWGTQFGKLLTAYRIWGNEADVRQAPIETLLKLYIRFHKEAETDPSLNDEGRAAFKALEDGDSDALALWNWFKTESLKEFQRIYDLLGVTFDSYNGEAYYNDKMEPVVEELLSKGLLVESDGAMVVELQEGMPPCLIKKSDGATLYATRDLAAAIDRKNNYDFVKSIYVVGNEQSLHFTQVKQVLGKMGHNWSNDIQHVPFGLILQGGKKMSTRKGKIVLLENVLKEAIELAQKNIKEKNPTLANQSEVADAVGVGAILFSDLKQHRKHDIEFNLESMLQVEGETGPYVQYANARAHSILRKVSDVDSFNVNEVNDYEWETIKLLEQFPHAVKRAADELDPSIIAKYAIDLAQAFNSFYGNVQVLTDQANLPYRSALIESVTIVLSESLRLLGMKAPEEM
ncbi:arginine--tRNA ligase [Sporosarcina thermotolerans]|uniref:Arginine--tRNA ligase n=2 Tax=Sporosarcina thermotolerans TaxID=633404 RepID=A0AAW9AGP0_9BACL|nr:arginine--tRNA ligase [Sporosarcina thermotolerans]MDW0118851.1 arginine--tRNA ligase [Sporosarcina thermotolerans]